MAVANKSCSAFSVQSTRSEYSVSSMQVVKTYSEHYGVFRVGA